jgi:hypothetical protein
MSALLAISYQVLPELQRVAVGWEVRALLMGIGLVLAYVVVRRTPVGPANGAIRSLREAGRHAAVCLAFGLIPSAILWIFVDLVRDELWLSEIAKALFNGDASVGRAAFIVTAGWLSWSIVFGKILYLQRTSRKRSLLGAPSETGSPSATDSVR